MLTRGRFEHLVHERGLSDARLPRHQEQFAPAGRDAVVSGAQQAQLRGAPIQVVGDVKGPLDVAHARRKRVLATPLGAGTAQGEVVGDALRTLVALLGSLREERHHELGQVRGDADRARGGRDRLTRDVRVYEVERVAAREGRVPREQPAEQAAEGVIVAPAVDRAVHAAGLLRRDEAQVGVGRRRAAGMRGLTLDRARRPELDQPHVTGRAVPENAVGREAPVQHAARVQVCERAHDA